VCHRSGPDSGTPGASARSLTEQSPVCCTMFVRRSAADLRGRPCLARGTTVAPAPFHCCGNPMADQALRILLVDQNVTRASILEEGLREAGFTNVAVVRDMQNLLQRIVHADPDVIFIDLENPNRDVLEQMFQVSRCVRRPIAMFVDHSDTQMIRAAVESGVGAYVVDGLRKERVKSILDMAVSRFNAFSQLRDELERAKQELEDRKVIERAKGILMKERGLSEEAAYGLLRKAAMNENRRVAEVAQSVVTAARLLK
jgi:response regulator NasT